MLIVKPFLAAYCEYQLVTVSTYRRSIVLWRGRCGGRGRGGRWRLLLLLGPGWGTLGRAITSLLLHQLLSWLDLVQRNTLSWSSRLTNAFRVRFPLSFAFLVSHGRNERPTNTNTVIIWSFGVVWVQTKHETNRQSQMLDMHRLSDLVLIITSIANKKSSEHKTDEAQIIINTHIKSFAWQRELFYFLFI